MARRGVLAESLPWAIVTLLVHGAAESGPVDWQRLSPDGQRLVRPVLATAQVARGVEHITYPSRREVCEYLLDHPDFASDVARALREGRYRVRRVGAHYDTWDGRGVSGRMRPLLSQDGRRIFYLEGQYDSRWLPPITGRAVLVLDSRYTTGTNGISMADISVQGYLRLDNRLLGAFLVLARDFSARTFEERVRGFFGHVERVTRRASYEPLGLLELLAEQPDLDRERLVEFRQLLLGRERALWDGPVKSSVGPRPLYMPSAPRASSITASVMVGYPLPSAYRSIAFLAMGRMNAGMRSTRASAAGLQGTAAGMSTA